MRGAARRGVAQRNTKLYTALHYNTVCVDADETAGERVGRDSEVDVGVAACADGGGGWAVLLLYRLGASPVPSQCPG